MDSSVLNYSADYEPKKDGDASQQVNNLQAMLNQNTGNIKISEGFKQK